MIGDGRLALFGNGTWSTKLGSKVPEGDVFAWHWLPIIPDFSFCLKALFFSQLWKHSYQLSEISV